jgi:predicted TIM-barrel fold metal-dependent hydrolase
MIIDIHFHMGGVEDDEDLFLSREMRSTLPYRIMKTLLLLKKGKADNQTAREYLLEGIEKAALVDKAVLLAFDWAYDGSGNSAPSRSHYYVSNDVVARWVKRRPRRLLFGASVNPGRKDAEAELERVKEMGAVLNKLIPSAQGVDLALQRHRPFFRKMADLQLPLLCHCGVEHAIPCCDNRTGNQVLNSTSKIQLALECGVTVIVAHCALPVHPEDGLRNYRVLKQLMKRPEYEGRLFADLAGFFLPLTLYRRKAVDRARKELDHARLLLGSDYPVPPSPILSGFARGMDGKTLLDLVRTVNPLDRNAKALRGFGFHERIFHNAERVLPVSEPRGGRLTTVIG